MAYKEIVTKAVIGKGKKKYRNSYQITVEQVPTTILGCWIINHNFSAREDNGKILINGSFDANIWYSYDSDTKTAVITKKITYTEEEKMSTSNKDIVNKDIIVRSLKQPTCISAKSDGTNINLEIEKELGLEIIGDTKVKISSVDEEETWDNLDSEEDKSIDKINENYINEEIIK
ncbi:MAG: outer spore coat protein CotE [Mycoplasmatota bacterium]|nr:outer spore coat protein CotE [Mycoplasmatota bacterium]